MENNLRRLYGLSPGSCVISGRGAVSKLDTSASFCRPGGDNPKTVSALSASLFHLAVPYRPPGGTTLGARIARCTETGTAPLTAIRRIVGAVRARHRRACARQELRELNDHLLKDIGLSRDAVDYESAKPFWR